MKSKLLYLVSGLLTLSILAAMFFGPSLYFSYEDWSKKTEMQTEIAGMEQLDMDLTIEEKLVLYARHTAFQQTGNTWLTGETQLSRTFIPSGLEIRQSYVHNFLRQALLEISGFFSQDLRIYQILAMLTKEELSPDTLNSTMCQLVSLSESTQGFVFWSIDFASGPWTCQFIMDAVTGKLYYLNINYYPNTYEYEGSPSSLIEEDNDIMTRNLYQFATRYWELALSAENTRYAPNAHNDASTSAYELNCDSPELSMSVNLSYFSSTSGYNFVIQPVYY